MRVVVLNKLLNIQMIEIYISPDILEYLTGLFTNIPVQPRHGTNGDFLVWAQRASQAYDASNIANCQQNGCLKSHCVIRRISLMVDIGLTASCLAYHSSESPKIKSTSSSHFPVYICFPPTVTLHEHESCILKGGDAYNGISRAIRVHERTDNA